ncbi:formyltransferase family protein [Prochlorococcus marinus]|uniref:formyltransferase family protein n=1 Tax=Prochlorococcus marinus TaxID=1219 RepID=UPI001ADA306E|nr:formyltransferase family protein [Prochlorococcus marinus]MBO8217656.1 methionyl-tRNA formyltransferase [Prochlorococcus marinus XMU1405]MBW3040818.1 methionyl-tRNA formyltransferase [Prochlorococcus marinus str. MU1405]MBW3048277.1 methionyl-tRNA formyltransferase [Prochlorococcus marinus str. MU1406]
MKLIICNSKRWFKLDKKISANFEVITISEKDDLNFDFISFYKPDYIFFVHWSWKVKKEIFKNFKCIVFHTAPLPYGRGGSPIQNLILSGFKESPVCAIKMEEELDSGAVYSSLNICLEGSLKEIFSRLNKVINKLIIKIIKNNIIPKAQEGKIHEFKRLSYKDNEIPNDINLEKFYDFIRMVDFEDYKKSYILYGDIKIEFSKAKYRNKSIICNCKITKCI